MKAMVASNQHQYGGGGLIDEAAGQGQGQGCHHVIINHSLLLFYYC
jgi:hypothetical protein